MEILSKNIVFQKLFPKIHFSKFSICNMSGWYSWTCPSILGMTGSKFCLDLRKTWLFHLQSKVVALAVAYRFSNLSPTAKKLNQTPTILTFSLVKVPYLILFVLPKPPHPRESESNLYIFFSNKVFMLLTCII